MSSSPAPVAPLVNRMAEAHSPYLLQHANNPVHWQPWGPEAFAYAQATNRPVFLSIGYAACHWCHVMAHESFEDQGIADKLNASFVCIKVDREERPDVDAVYMSVTQALNHGRGGWPMTVVMTGDKVPFFAGTYFPPQATRGMPGFLDIIDEIARLWRDDREQLVTIASSIAEAMQQHHAPNKSSQPLPSPREVTSLTMQALGRLKERFDEAHGGFTQAPKFPHTESLQLLVAQVRKDTTLLWHLTHTLDSMARGGLYDLVGGGFSRYSVDARWHVPHFEKMLYDNALLAATYGEAAMALHKPEYAVVAKQTLEFVLRELCQNDGLFQASLDADSEGAEGRFYTWSYAEAHSILTTAMGQTVASEALEALSFSPEGHLEDGRNIPRLKDGLSSVSPQLRQALSHLYEARKLRLRPTTDTKIITGHNGLMLSALATGCRALSEPHYLAVAERAADSLWEHVVEKDGSVLRLPVHTGGPRIHGMLEDYAYFAQGLLAVYEAGGAARHLHRAKSLCQSIPTLFADAESGGLYSTCVHHETLLFRPQESHDGATPSPWSVACAAMLRAATLTGDGGLQHHGQKALAAMVQQVRHRPDGHCQALLALELLGHEGDEAAFVAPGGPWHERNRALFAKLVGNAAPYQVVAHHDITHGDAEGPLCAQRPAVDNKATVYLCRNHTCLPPIVEEQLLQQALADN